MTPLSARLIGLMGIVALGGGTAWLLLSSPEAPPPAVVPGTAQTEDPALPKPPAEEAPPVTASVPSVPLDLPPPGTPAATFARIQTGLNHAAAGRAALPADPAADRLERVAEALRLILAGDAAGANRVLDAAEAAIAAALPSEAKMAADPAAAERQEWLVSYFELLPSPNRSVGGDAVTAAFVRLAVVLRKVDAVLLSRMLPRLGGYDLVARRAAEGPSAFDGLGLRFPCRLAATQRPRLEAAARALRHFSAPLTDCPVPPSRAADFAALERIAHDPAAVLAAAGPGRTVRPGVLASPLIHAAATGGMAEIEAAVRAGADPLRADERGRIALHYLAANRALSAAERSRAAALLF